VRLSGKSFNSPLHFTLFMVAQPYYLVVAALGAREGSYFSRAVCGHDSSLIPIEDVAALLALLPEGNDRAALVDDLSTSHLYRHLAELLARADPLVALPPK
jgi:hypothetical protein